MHLRHARHDDVAAMIAIAAAGGSPDADERYLDFVASHGRLVVAHADGTDEADDGIGGFAGSIAIGDVAMVTDLFVDEAHRGRGLGRRLLSAVLDGSWRRMTFSSTHPAALPTYAGLGMVPRWDLLTLRGVATGGGAPLPQGPWRHDRRDLIEYFRSRGASVGPDHVVHMDDIATVWRLVSEQPEIDAAALLAALPPQLEVEWSLPEPHPLATWLQSNGFVVVDRDVCCATDGVHLVPQVCSVHRGLL